MPAGSSNNPPAWRDWLAELPGRLKACWRLKLMLSALAMFGFCVPFILLEHFPMRAVHESPRLGIDVLLGFHPDGWVWVYQSVYLPINVIPWLARSRDQLVRFVRGFVVLSVVSFFIFIVFPTRVTRPPLSSLSGMCWLLSQYDTPLSAMPSLHAGLLAYALCCGRQIFRGSLPRGLAEFVVAWGILILVATLLTKEHYVLDLVAGTLLGLIAYRLSWRGSRQADDSSPRSVKLLATAERVPCLPPLPAES